MYFGARNTILWPARVLGYVTAYFVFTLCLYLILKFTGKIETFLIVPAITASVAVVGLMIERWVL